jgi:anaerobic selenocysteine-containing dehydrogenase
MAVRSIACLPAIVGAWRAAGGGVLLSTSGFFEFDQRTLERPDLMMGSPRTINMSRLGEALTEARPPVRAIYVYNSNPAAVAPDQSKVIAGFKREDLFTVVHEQFQTDTADYADILLPATTQLEHQDVVKPYGHYYVVYNAAIAPLAKRSRTRNLSPAPSEWDSGRGQGSDEVIQQALNSGHPTLDGITVGD